MAFQYAPNRTGVNFNPTATWRVLGKDGTLYASISALRAAGTVTWPGLDPGAFLQYITARSAAGSPPFTDGSSFEIAFNQATAPADTGLPPVGRLISGAGQTLNDPGPIWNVWVKSNTPSDWIELSGGY